MTDEAPATEAPPASPAPTPEVPAEKPRRKTHARKESAESYHSTDSTGNSLAAVEPKYHQRALDVIKSPRSFDGQLVWLVDSTLNPLPSAWSPPKLKDCSRIAFLTCFAQDRPKDGSRLYVIIYIRVSSRGQALKGTALQSTLRWMLKKCERHGLWAAGIAVDIESGREEDRSGLTKVMDAVQQGQVRCIVVPAISRLERNEAHFGMRMQALSDVESWVYYGQTYEDPYFDYAAWTDWDSRDRAVTQVRAAEKYVKDGIDGVASTDRNKLQNSYLVSSNKGDTFCIYDINIEDSKRPNAFRKIVRVPTTSKQVYDELKAAIMDGAARKDASVLAALAKAQSERTKKAIEPDDLWWELAVGWPIGKNQRSPHSDDGLSAECEDLIVEEDVDAYWELLKAFADLQGLCRRQRAKTVLASDALDKVLKAKIAEAQAARKDGVRFRLSCDCTTPPTPVQWVGDGPKGSDVSQDWVICPNCDSGGSGKPDKRLLPEKRDVRKAMAAPSEPCHKCGRFLPLVEETKVSVGALEWKVYRCSECVGLPQLGQPQVVAPPPHVSPEVPKKRRAKRVEAELPWDGIQRPRLEPPEQAPQGAPPLYGGPIPDGPFYDEVGLRPIAVADRLEAFMRSRPGLSFTTDQLRAVAVGGQVKPGSPPILTKRWNRGQKYLKDRLAAKGMALRSVRREGGKLHFFWLETIGRGPQQTIEEAAAAATGSGA